MSLLTSIFCNHKWTSHAKTTYKWVEIDVKSKITHHSQTNEVLICKCGKIVKIVY